MLTANVSVLSIKRGDSFKLVATYTDELGQPIDLTPYTITSQIRTPAYQIVSTLVTTKSTQSGATLGQYILDTQSGTGTWPVGDLLWDIQYDNGISTISTDTMNITILKDVTY